MIRWLRAWWNAPLWSMPHLPEPRGIPWKWITRVNDPDCPPNAMYGMSADTYDRLKKQIANPYRGDQTPFIVLPPLTIETLTELEDFYGPRCMLIERYGEFVVKQRNANFTAITES